MLFGANPGVTGTVKICQRIKQWLNERFPLQLEESALRVLQLEINAVFANCRFAGSTCVKSEMSIGARRTRR